jgi:hypothetical protein
MNKRTLLNQIKEIADMIGFYIPNTTNIIKIGMSWEYHPKSKKLSFHQKILTTFLIMQPHFFRYLMN